MTTSTRAFLDDLNRTSVRLHVAKEDAFWTAYMGLAEDADAARSELDARDIEGQRFLSDPERQAAVRAALREAEASGDASEEELVALRGWLRTLEAHGIESAEGRALAEEIVGREGELARRRGSMELSVRTPDGGREPASSVKLALTLGSEPDAEVRRDARRGLRSIEDFVLANGFLELVAERNRLGRMLGGEDFYDWKARREEGMSKAEIFELLDELEEKTRASARSAIEGLRERHGDELDASSAPYFMSGDVTRELDPYFPFERAIDRWGRSFSALGIRYRGARLVLDLVDRKGKYENGFMHGPEIAWREHGRFHPARIHFTANAIPGMVGSGRRALETLFHEGGHAAHFANVDMPAPCFGQEFPPTSAAMAETQSMFLDSLVADADWCARYAKTLDGVAMPWELFESSVRTTQPFQAWSLRVLITICYVERALYELPEEELVPERVLEVVRDVEQRLLFLEDGRPNPSLAIPHLLSGDSAASYHGYALAEMAVHQTRDFFEGRDGHLVDNPRIGPALRDTYWAPGNSKPFKAFVEELTGEPLSAAALARDVNRSVDEALADARTRWEREPELPRAEGPVELDARIRVAHGNETVAELGESDFEAFSAAFADWIAGRVAART